MLQFSKSGLAMDEGGAAARLQKQENAIALRVVAFGIVACLAYFAFFVTRRFEIGGPEAWGQFGDFFGGLVNPVVGIVTVILVVRTLHETRKASDLTRLEMQEQTRLFAIQLDRYDREAKLSELQKRLEGALAAWNLAMSQEYESLEADLIKAGVAPGHAPTFGQMFANSTIENQIVISIGDSDWPRMARNWERLAHEPINLLRELGQYCDDYDKEVGNRILTDFYRHRVNGGMRALYAAGFVLPDTYQKLKVGRLFHMGD